MIFVSLQVKGVNFFGPKSEYVVSGSDCGHVFLWDRESEEIVQYLQGDDTGVVSTIIDISHIHCTPSSFVTQHLN